MPYPSCRQANVGTAKIGRKQAMIDTHCHILPELDDGAGSTDEALTMARIAVADGIQQMVATPHQKNWDTAFAQEIVARLQHFHRELVFSGIQLALAGGVEMILSHELLEPAGDERSHTLNGSRYLLLELPANDYPLYTREVIFDLELRGLVPILAHPERNAAIQDDPNRMVRLARRGVLGQLIASSLLAGADRTTRSTARRLLKRGLVQLLATDGHDADRRAPRLAEGVRAAARLVGREQAEAMVTTVPEAILADREVDAEMFRPPERVRWWRGLRFLRRDGEE
jgi:protein-tyrosine phosphatase